MSTFTKSSTSNKNSECRRLAARIAAAATAMGLACYVEESRISASHYLYVAANADTDDKIKIRCSDHADKTAGSDWYIWVGDCPSGMIARIASEFRVAVPPGHSADDYASRANAARAAADARNRKRLATEDEMAAAVVAAMGKTKSSSVVAAGAIVDEIYPGIPRAQRQRLANAARYSIVRDRAIATAVDDEAALAKLSIFYPEAKAALLKLVGPERFPTLRPPGYPRTLWSI